MLPNSMLVTVCGCGFAPMDNLKTLVISHRMVTLESEGHRVFIYIYTLESG